MHAWVVWPSPSLFERALGARHGVGARRFALGLGVSLLAGDATGCGQGAGSVDARGQVIAEVGGLPISQEAVAIVATRDGIDLPLARQRVIETQRLVAMRRDAADSAEEGASAGASATSAWRLDPEREQQLRD